MTVKALSYLEIVTIVRSLFDDEDISVLKDEPTRADLIHLYNVYQSNTPAKFEFIPAKKSLFLLMALKLTEIYVQNGPGARFWAPPERTKGLTDEQYLQVLRTWAMSLS